MPAKMTLEKIHSALEQRKVVKNLDAYAVGVLLYEQKKYRKSLITLRNRLDQLDQSSSDYQVAFDSMRAAEQQPELGFYYTISLFDQLRETKPREATRMIQALLSFDTMGRYLLEERPIILDGKPFVLDGLLFHYKDIDIRTLKATALQNRLNTTYLSDAAPQIENAPGSPKAFSLPENMQELSTRTKNVLTTLHSEASGEILLKKMLQNPLDFDLVTQPATPENIGKFILILVEMFEHAKVQDSSNLYTLNLVPPPGAKRRDYSTVAFLQNNLSCWLFLSLIQAPNADILNQRMRFIMAFLVVTNQKASDLPVNANADLYLPLFILSTIIFSSDLQTHPAVERKHLRIMKEMSGKHNANTMTAYTNRIELHRDGDDIHLFGTSRHLTPMRMYMTTHLVLREEYSVLVNHVTEKKAAIAEANGLVGSGRSIYDYFNPKHHSVFKALSKMTPSAVVLFNQQSLVMALFEGTRSREVRDILLTVSHLYKATDGETIQMKTQPIHKPLDSIEEQLHILEKALLTHGPIIFHQEEAGNLVCCAGGSALSYIKSQVLKLGKQACDSSDPLFVNKISHWCTALLTYIPQLEYLQMPFRGVLENMTQKAHSGASALVSDVGMFRGDYKRSHADAAKTDPSPKPGFASRWFKAGAAEQPKRVRAITVSEGKVAAPVALRRERSVSDGTQMEPSQTVSDGSSKISLV